MGWIEHISFFFSFSQNPPLGKGKEKWKRQGLTKVEEKERGESTLHSILTTEPKAHTQGVHKAAEKNYFKKRYLDL